MYLRILVTTFVHYLYQREAAKADLIENKINEYLLSEREIIFFHGIHLSELIEKNIINICQNKSY